MLKYFKRNGIFDAGLYEAVYALIGQTHTSGEGKKFALQILQKLNDYCEKWKKRENIGYSLYGSPKHTYGPLVSDHQCKLL